MPRENPGRTLLKIHKAKYGSVIYVNRSWAGRHLPCFTPAVVDIAPFLKPSGQENEILIRVGAEREVLPKGQPTGWDFEKHWNFLRYCIGFPPDFWYDIADEEGLLLADEFPIWLLGEAPENPAVERITPEYREWMRERWNHPSVVIWDAQNESHTRETGKAIRAVRHLDLSNRPWDNGWAEPQSPTDVVEAHPYFFISDFLGRPGFRLSDLAGLKGVPHLMEAQKRFQVPVIINEYGWLWLQCNGEPTSLTEKTYRRLLGEDSTTEERRELYARYLAALTEFWRAHRQAAGVVHFCGLGYSRPGDKPRPEGGATSMIHSGLGLGGLPLSNTTRQRLGPSRRQIELNLATTVPEGFRTGPVLRARVPDSRTST